MGVVWRGHDTLINGKRSRSECSLPDHLEPDEVEAAFGAQWAA